MVMSFSYCLTIQNFITNLEELKIWNCFKVIVEAAITITEVKAIIEAITLCLDFRIFFNSNLFYYCYHLVNYC